MARILLALLLFVGSAAGQTLSVVSPNGGEQFTAGTVRQITWAAQGLSAEVRVRYTVNNGGTWNTIQFMPSTATSIQWVVPNQVSAACKIRVEHYNTARQPTDDSNGVFSIIASAPPVDTVSKMIRVTWNRNTEADLAGYRVYFGDRSRMNAPYESYVAVTDTTYTKLFGAGTHFFAVTALDHAGNESEYSDEVFAVIEAPPRDEIAPAKPAGVGISVQ